MTEKQVLTIEENQVLEQFDFWLNEGGPAALVIREPLEPVEGPDGVFFPATFAAEQGNDPDRFRGGYNIDTFPDGTNVCLLDTVGSQGNRIEPMFAKPDYAGLVPQISISISDSRTISLLEAGHRSGDAIVRCSELRVALDEAFRALSNGNAEQLAKIAPTSLVFGVWDSRGTQAKLPRLVSATIRAFNVYRHTRHAQYNPVINFKKEGLLDGIDASDDDLAAKGYVSQPIGRQVGKPDPTHGGVQLMKGERLRGSIRRDATLGLAALRRLAAFESEGKFSKDRTDALRRYILGLTLVALTGEYETYLRQGCNLVPADEGKSRTFEIVHPSGKREPCTLTHPNAKEYAKVAAKAFGVGESRTVLFDKKLAEKDIKGDKDKLKGEVASLDNTDKKFKMKIGKGKDQKELDVATGDSTRFTRGKVDSTFEQVVIVGAKLDVEVNNGIAAKVAAKK